MENTLKTTVNSRGIIVFYEMNDFYQKIILEKDCFICGAKKESKVFNDEHILPNWLLTKYKLHNKRITLPNLIGYKYSSYTISCCKECNEALSRHFEMPVSNLLKLPYKELVEAILHDESYYQLLFEWCTLIYFKVQIKDTELHWKLNKKEGIHSIGESYNWLEYHHIHCMLRRFHTGAFVDKRALGSFILLPALEARGIESFDIATHTKGQTIMIRVGGICIVCVLDDSHAASDLCRGTVRKFTNSLIPVQLREVFCHATYINMNLKERPQYHSEYQHGTEKYFIRAAVPSYWNLFDKEYVQISIEELLERYCGPMIGDRDDREHILEGLKAGKYNFLFNENGHFLDYSNLSFFPDDPNTE